MLRAVTFDLWETLIHEDPAADAPRRAYRVREVGRILRQGGLAADDGTLERAHEEVLARMDPYWAGNLDLSILEQTKMFIETAGIAVDGRFPAAVLLDASRHYADAALKYPPRAAAGAAAALAAARASGLRLALLCNTGRTPGKVLREILGTLEMKPFFDVLCFSDEIRLRKPATEFFTRALQRLGVRPDEAVHVGDMPDTDLKGAKAAGMRTIHLRREGRDEAPPGMADFTIASMADLPAVLGKLLTAPSSSQPMPMMDTPPPAEGLGRDTVHL
jgi:putative hydrolase of the HAD superfamily